MSLLPLTCLISVAFAQEPIKLVFHDSAQVNDTLIRLGNVAKISGGPSEIPVGLSHLSLGRAAPPGFARYVSPHEALTYYISSQFPKYTFQVNSFSRCRVKTTYRSISFRELEDTLRLCIRSLLDWDSATVEIELLDTGKVVRIYDRPYSVVFPKQPDTRPYGYTTYNIVIKQDLLTREIPVRFAINVTMNVLVTSRLVSRGEELNSENCRLKSQDITLFRYKGYTQLNQIRGAVAARTMKPGTLLHRNNIQTVPLIQKGDQVELAIMHNNIRLSVMVRARENGYRGDRIWVENLDSHKVVRAIVQDCKSVVMTKKGGVL